MKPKVTFNGVTLSDYCETRCRAACSGRGGECWKCLNIGKCCNCSGCDLDTSAFIPADGANPTTSTTTPTGLPDDGRWWADPYDPAANDFFGVLITDIVYGPSFTRSVSQASTGGSIGRLAPNALDITLNGIIVSASEQGTDYGVSAINSLLAGSAGTSCEDGLGDLVIHPTCVTCQTGEEKECTQEILNRISNTIGTKRIRDVICQAPTNCGTRLVPVADVATLTGDLNCDDDSIAELNTLLTGRNVLRVECLSPALVDVPMDQSLTVQEKILAAVDRCNCRASTSAVTVRRAAARGPVVEIDSTLKRCCGTVFSVTFVAETPYKFQTTSPTIEASYGLTLDPTPNWCCGFCAATATGTTCGPAQNAGTSGLSALGVSNQAGVCYCEPLFVDAGAELVESCGMFPSFVGWSVTAGPTELKNVSVCIYEDIGGVSPLSNPGTYCGVTPTTSRIVSIPASETLTYSASTDALTLSSGNAVSGSASPAIVPGNFWIVVKSSTENNNEAVRWSYRTEIGRI